MQKQLDPDQQRRVDEIHAEAVRRVRETIAKTRRPMTFLEFVDRNASIIAVIAVTAITAIGLVVYGITSGA